MRQIKTAAELKRHFPGMLITGSGYSYLGPWIPNVGQAVVREGGADFIGLGRMMFAYHDMPADILEGRGLDRKRLCAACSRCSTAPRQGLASGCYLLDPFYKKRRRRT